MPWAPPEVESKSSDGDWSPPETQNWSPPEVALDAPESFESSPATDFSGIKPSPYETFDRNGMKPESGMEAGNEFLTAAAQDPVGFALSIPRMAGTALEHVGAAALNIPQAMYREATGETPKRAVITDESISQVPEPLFFQPGKPTVEFGRTQLQPEGNQISRLIEGLSTPGMLASFPFAGTKAVQALFLTQTAPGAIEAAVKLVNPNLSADEKQQAATDLLLNGLMTYGLAKHLNGDVRPPPENIPVKGAPNASPITSPESLSQPEIRPPVGEETPLRQPGEITGAPLESVSGGPPTEVVPPVKPEVLTPSPSATPSGPVAPLAAQQTPPAVPVLTYDNDLSASNLKRFGVVRDLNPDNGGDLIRVNGQPAGWMHVSDDGVIDALEIKPEFRKQGVASNVLRDFAKTQGSNRIKVFLPTEQGRPLLESLGDLKVNEHGEGVLTLGEAKSESTTANVPTPESKPVEPPTNTNPVSSELVPIPESNPVAPVRAENAPTETVNKPAVEQRQPWEMSRFDYAKSKESPLPEHFSAMDAIAKKNNRSPYNPDLITEDAIKALKEKGYISGTKHFKLTESGRNFLSDARRTERENQLASGDASDNHLEIVEKAVKEGKPVPQSVLDDYPEFFNKPTPAAKPVESSIEPGDTALYQDPSRPDRPPVKVSVRTVRKLPNDAEPMAEFDYFGSKRVPVSKLELFDKSQAFKMRKMVEENKARDAAQRAAKPAEAKGKVAETPSESDRLAAEEEARKRQGELASDWTGATDESKPSQAAPEVKKGEPPTAGPQIVEFHAGVPIPKFANRKMSGLDKVTAEHSGKLQRSMSEARRAQKEIKMDIPSERRQAAASIYREAGGDMAVLKDWETRAKQKWMRDAARDAQTLTPKEIAVVKKAEAAFAVLENRGNRFDVLKSHRDNYIPHVWDVKKPGTGFGTSMLKQRFKFSKARTLDTFFDGDQAGFKPKTLAIGKLLPAYIHEMNTVIADRQFVRDLVAGEAKDGSPLAVPRGNVKVVDGPGGKAVLVQPKSMRDVDTEDYKVMNDQPALSGWTWEGKDTDGKPVFVKADLALHPEAYRRVNAMLGQSAIRTWYRDPVTGTAQIPRAVARGLDTAQAAMKREMFGLLAPFHQVQEGTHAVGHLVNPFFGLEKVDLSKNPKQLDAANHGLMLLPDRASSRVYLEGVGAKSSLISRGIRKLSKPGELVADVIDGYQDYLFHQYIPALKFKTYEAMVARNTKLYAKELASGEMTEADVKITSAEQSNAAYGHLNYALLDRNPTLQHMIQLGTLAPDFLEARGRFAAQAFKGLSSKVGKEQLKAVAIIAATQAGTAFILSNLLGSQYDPKHPFEVVYKGRRYAMRSVPEDLHRLLFEGGPERRQFVSARMNPVLQKLDQLRTGLNYRGEKTTSLDTMEELLANYIPITARQIPGIRSLTESSRNNPVTPLQQLAGSLGLRISRHSPISETYNLAAEWMDAQKMPRDRGSYPVSKYQQLRYALEDGDLERAKTEFVKLKESMDAAKISKGFRESINHPFTGSKATDETFRESLKGYDRQMFNQALRTRENILNSFGAIGGSTTAPHELRPPQEPHRPR